MTPVPQKVIGALADWAQVQLSLDQVKVITITHPDEAALGRIFMQLVEMSRTANAADKPEGESNVRTPH